MEAVGCNAFDFRFINGNIQKILVAGDENVNIFKNRRVQNGIIIYISDFKQSRFHNLRCIHHLIAELRQEVINGTFFGRKFSLRYCIQFINYKRRQYQLMI